MATLTPRQPFGMVTEARLRNLTNVKNTQSALLSTSSKSLKRAYEAEDSASDNDNENIDPAIFLSPSKKGKGHDGLAKPQKFMLKASLSTSTTPTARSIATPRGLSVKTRATPISAPAGGRSPIKKRGILSRHRVSSSPFTRVDPPAMAKGNGMPFSLDAALQGTVGRPSKPVSDLKAAMPGQWFFEIHEDTPDEELSNLVQHSTQTLDISDDESKARERDERGKENIPPADLVVVPVARQDIMSEETRTPLGDLNTTDYYAAGCDENSIIIIPEDQEIDFAFDGAAKKGGAAVTGGQGLLKELLSKSTKLPPPSPVEIAETANELVPAKEPIEIYESESADEADPAGETIPA